MHMYDYYNPSTFLSLVILTFILFLFQCTNAIFYLFHIMTDNLLAFDYLSVIAKKRFKINEDALTTLVSASFFIFTYQMTTVKAIKWRAIMSNHSKFPYLAYRGGGGIFLIVYIIIIALMAHPVSYTHLDVYKRQVTASLTLSALYCTFSSPILFE